MSLAAAEVGTAPVLPPPPPPPPPLPPPAVTTCLVKFVGRKAGIRPTISQLDGESGGVDESESEDRQGNAPLPTSFSPLPCSSPTTPAAPLAVLTTAASTSPALFSDEHLARLQA